MLQIRLLGDFAILEDGRPIDAPSGARLQSLLAFLLVHRAAIQHRKHLAFLLWPDSTEGQALTNLRKLIYLARRAIPQADRFIGATRLTLCWRSDVPFALDVADFEEALSEVKHAGDKASLEDAIERATSLYAGEFLEHLDAEWIATERLRLHRQLEAALSYAIHWFEDRGELALAIRYAKHQLQIDPLREQSYQELMRLHTVDGDRGSCLRAYEACVQTLSSQLGVRPSPTTQRMAAQQLDGASDRVQFDEVSRAYNSLIHQWPATPSTSTRVVSYLVAFAQVAGHPSQARVDAAKGARQGSSSGSQRARRGEARD